MSSKAQASKLLAALKQRPLTTLEIRNDLFIMSVPATNDILRKQGYVIDKTMVRVGSNNKRIAQYTLVGKAEVSQ